MPRINPCHVANRDGEFASRKLEGTAKPRLVEGTDFLLAKGAGTGPQLDRYARGLPSLYRSVV